MVTCRVEVRQKEGKEVEDDVRGVEKEVRNALLTANFLDLTTSGVFGWVEAQEMGDVERSSSCV